MSRRSDEAVRGRAVGHGPLAAMVGWFVRPVEGPAQAGGWTAPGRVDDPTTQPATWPSTDADADRARETISSLAQATASAPRVPAASAWRRARRAPSRERARIAARASELALLSRGRGALGRGAAIALAGAGSGVAVLGFWSPEEPTAARVGASPPSSFDGPDRTSDARRVGGLALPAARRTVASLQARGLTARAAGRLVVVELPGAQEAAVEGWWRVRAAVADTVATVLLIAGARGAGWDDVLRGSDRVLVDGGDGALVALAVAQLTELGATAQALDGVPSGAVRALALAGLALPGTLRSLRSTLGASA
jgi:hypothetical protein